MARKRSISPMIWEDPTFNSLSVGARLLFVGMFSNADDEGYIRGDIGSLKRLIFGFDSNTEGLAGWIEEVRAAKNIHFYEVGGEQYAHFLKWDKHQKQQKDRIQDSTYPPCSICVASAEQVRPKGKLSKVKLSKDNILGSKSRTGTQFSKEDYNLVIKSYETLKETKFQGREYLPIQQSIKTMFLSGRTAKEIIDCMEWFADSAVSKKKELMWTRNWTIDTVRKKLPEFLSGAIG